MNPIYLVGGVAVVLALYIISVYNSLQTLKTQVEASIQEIGNQLKRQASLIPNLEASAKGFLKHEKDIFTELTSARKAVENATVKDARSVADVERKLNEVLPKIQILVESNPELKSDNVVTGLMDELRDTADKLMYSRRAVIDITQQFNQMLVVFPSNIVGNMFGFKKLAGLATPVSGTHMEVSEAELEEPKVKL